MSRRLALLFFCLAPLACSRPPAAPPFFREVTRAAGLNYRWEIPGQRPLTILQSVGNGVAFLDFDGDGNLDILLVGRRVALYRGDGKGRFADVTAPTLGDVTGHFLGVAAGDIDDDGDVDVYLSGYREGRVLKNEGRKRLVDVSAVSGILAQPWGTSAAFVDADRDGKLDLFVGNYVVFGPETDPQRCIVNGIATGCGPGEYQAERARFYRGLGDGRFVDATAQWGVERTNGAVLGVAAIDCDGSGHLSLALANDQRLGDLLRSDGATFHNRGVESGTAYSEDGGVHGGMGVDWGDYNNDGKPDLFVATYRNEAKDLYRNDGDGLFTRCGTAAGLAPTFPLVTYGAKWLDADNDGWLDLALANGHVLDNVAQGGGGVTYRQPLHLYQNQSGTKFVERSATWLDPAGQRPLVGRGLATGDYDNDGRVDLLVADAEGEPVLLHNENPHPGHWIGFAVTPGAIVTIEAGGKRFVRYARADGSYLSSSDPRVHCGLGAATKAEKVTVRWPDGKTRSASNLAADRYYRWDRANASPGV